MGVLANGGYWRCCVFGLEEDGGVFVEILLRWVGVFIEVSGSKLLSIFSLLLSMHSFFVFPSCTQAWNLSNFP